MPPAVVLVHEVLLPKHNVAGPVIAGGNGVTVTVAVEKQPEGMVKLMIAVPPDRPVTTPVVGFTVATDVALLLQVPDDGGGRVDKEVVWPSHKLSVPVMAGGMGSGLTVTTATTVHPPST